MSTAPVLINMQCLAEKSEPDDPCVSSPGYRPVDFEKTRKAREALENAPTVVLGHTLVFAMPKPLHWESLVDGMKFKIKRGE